MRCARRPFPARLPRLARALALVLAPALSLAAAGAQGLPRDVRLEILRAVVQIVPLDSEAGAVVDWSGSGTIISPSGYILTNYHVVGDLDLRRHHEWHAVLVTDPAFTDQPPEFVFWARFVAGDPTHDLALLKIVEWYDEEPVPADFAFPHVTVGDSNDLIPGDPITIVGYPGISGSTITLTSGLMSGWLGEDFEGGGKQWIKTDGKIAHGNSGGGAFDADGHLIGVPTAGRTVRYEELDVEEQAYVRPISLAWALIGPNVADVARPGRGAPAGGAAPQAAPAAPSVPPAAEAGNPLAGGAGNQPAGGLGNPLAGGARNPLGAGLGAPLGGPGGPGAPAGGAADLPGSGAPQCDFCTVGPLPLGGSASGTLRGYEGTPNYHTYTVEVPAGTATLVIEMKADFDLDAAVRYGSQITTYADDGDWDQRDLSDAHGARFVIAQPAPGTYYVDVMNLYNGGAGTYTLSAR